MFQHKPFKLPNIKKNGILKHKLFPLREIKTGILQHVGNDLTRQQCQGRTLTKTYEVEFFIIRQLTKQKLRELCISCSQYGNRKNQWQFMSFSFNFVLFLFIFCLRVNHKIIIVKICTSCKFFEMVILNRVVCHLCEKQRDSLYKYI